VISFGHIYELTLALHQSVLAARLMPVAIDGLITVGSVVLLQSGSRLGWLGVGPGLALSVFANVESGLQYGWLSAVWAGIPALSFFLATFILERWLKSQSSPAMATIPSAGKAAETVASEAETAPVAVPETVAAIVPEVVPVDVPETEPASTVPPVPVVRVRTVASGRAPRRAQAARPKAAEKLFAAEIESGELPSLREVKRRAGCGTDRARALRDQLADTMQEVPAVA
jgi:hypothetical protein